MKANPQEMLYKYINAIESTQISMINEKQKSSQIQNIQVLIENNRLSPLAMEACFEYLSGALFYKFSPVFLPIQTNFKQLLAFYPDCETLFYQKLQYLNSLTLMKIPMTKIPNDPHNAPIGPFAMMVKCLNQTPALTTSFKHFL
jgi:hypothetical protein